MENDLILNFPLTHLEMRISFDRSDQTIQKSRQVENEVVVGNLKNPIINP